ncbi:unnamed protein product [Rhizoctonia solani]|uniref:Protein kinase domain-containing protein n=1 Tax=Rhizoctonia solani TaxID=456999 RepID=A0A8H3DJF1_9AGAM|nr:unnamed protein product [Rhizoctonia solani]
MDSTSSSLSLATNASPWTEHALQISTPAHKYLGGGDPSAERKLRYVAAPLPRAYHSSSMVSTPSGDIFIFGGAVGGQLKNDIWAIRLSRDSKPPLGPEDNIMHLEVIASLIETTGEVPSPRVGHKSVLANGLLLVWGGITSVTEPDDNSIYSLDITTYRWSRIHITPGPSARALHAACMCGGKFVVFGGAAGKNQVLNDLWSFDPSPRTPKWERVEVAPGAPSPPSRGGHAMIAYEEKLYIFGGSNNETLYRDTWCFDMVTRTWTELECPGLTPPPHAYHAVAVVGDDVYAFGGRGEDWTEFGDTWRFKISEHRWYTIPSTGSWPSERCHHILATIEGRVLVVGGEGDKNSRPEDTALIGILDTNLINYPENRAIDPPLLMTSIEHPRSVTSTQHSTRDTLAEEELSINTIPTADDPTFEITEINTFDLETDGTRAVEPDVSIGDLRSGVSEGRSGLRVPSLSQRTAFPPSQLTITGAMSTTKIFRNLVLHGCHDVSKDLDISRVSEYPVSSGGFGDVYCATLRTGVRVGLKCLRMMVGSTEEGNKFLKRAAHELYVWSKCKHPNVLELSGVMIFRDRIAMVSPWVENGHLRWFLSRDPQVDRCALCVQIADGVGYLHEQGIVHGDLKPENVLISQDYTPKLTDFGNAALAEYTLQFTNSSTTQSMSVRWTAPEILKQETKTTQAGDMFALGMITFEVITGILPYVGVSDPVAMFSIAAGKLPERPQAHIPSGVKQADRLWSAIASCWAYNPNERPKAQEIRSMMDGITSGELEHEGCQATFMRLLRNRPPIAEELAGNLCVRRFGYNIIQTVTSEETQGQTNRSTAKRFLLASHLLEILPVFGPLDAEVEETLKYARSRTDKIVHALRRGALIFPFPCHSTPLDTPK